MLAELSAALAKPQAAPRWSGAFVRCQQRGWMTMLEPCTYALTGVGAAVARVGRDLPRWRDADDAMVVEALHAATADEGGAVTADPVAWRFSHGHRNTATAQHVSQRLRRLEERGLVRRDGRSNAGMVRWCPY